jgi:Xaa-Pro aminopeptidase
MLNQSILDDMLKVNLDCLLILKSINIRYLTGFKPSSLAVLLIKDDPLLFVTKLDIDEATLKSDVEIMEFKSLEEIKSYMKGNVGIEYSMNVGTFEKIKKDFKTELTDIVENKRRLKTKDEIENIKKAVYIAEKSIENLNFSGKECEIAALIEYNMRIKGSQKAAFDTIVASGSRSSFPHATVSNEKLESPIIIDWGAIYKDYCSDNTRVVLETERQEEIFDVVFQAQKEAINSIKPGIKASYVDKVARDVIQEYGYKDLFVHSTGHGVGLEVHESPSLAKKEKLKLEKEMVVTIEPGIYLKNEFGMRIEDMIHIKNRAKILNKSKKILNA